MKFIILCIALSVLASCKISGTYSNSNQSFSFSSEIIKYPEIEVIDEKK